MNSCRLRSVKIYNFKSYKGLVEIANFKEFIAVMGPNGSGKSNFMDAVGFALGENNKNLRVNKLSEFIHNVEAQKTLSNSCYVELLFFWADGTEKKFKRTALGNSRRNKFEVNDSIVSSEAYQKELNLIGICNFGKSCLVFQGDIESISLQDSMTRCKFFERMCGSDNIEEEYLIAKREMHDAQKKVEATFKKVRIVDAEVKALSNESKEATIFINLQKEEKHLKRSWYLFNLFHIENEIRKLSVMLGSKFEEEDVLKCEKREAEGILVNLNESIKDGNTVLSQLNEAIENKEILLEKEKIISIKVREEIKFLQRQKVCASRTLADSEKKRELQQKNIFDLKQNGESIKNQLEILRESLSSSPQFLTEFQFEEYSRLKVEAEKQTALYSQEIQPRLSELKKFQDRLYNKMQKMEEITKSIQLWTKNYQNIEQRIENLRQHLETTRNSLSEQEEIRDNLEKELNDYRSKLSELEEELKILNEYLRNATYEKDCFEKDKKKAERIRYLQAHVPDVVGRLNDLCKPIHSRYNLAFAKIFDKYADAIVTKTKNAALNCIEVLRDKTLGRETFIALDIIKPQQIKQSLRTIGNVKLALDVINFQPENEPAVRFVTKNTLICENTETAKELSSCHKSKGEIILGHTCVSLNGTLYSKYGIVSGGTFDLTKKISRWDDQEIENRKLRKQKIKEELNAITQKIRDEYKLEALNSKIEGLKRSNKFMQDHLQSVVKEKAELDTKLLNLNDEKEEISNEIEDIKLEISEKEEAINVVKNRISEVEERIFGNFCREIGFENIQEYETSDINFQEKCERVQELQAHLDKINAQLEYEEGQNFEGEISKWKKFELEKQREADAKSEEEMIKKAEIKKLENELKNERINFEAKKAEVNEAIKICQEYEKSIRAKSQEMKKIIASFAEINKKKSMFNFKIKEILRTCQSQVVEIPLVSGNLENFLLFEEEDSEPFIEIDYSGLQENYKLEECKSTIDQELNKKLCEVQENLERLSIPNQQAKERLKELQKQQKNIKKTLKEEKQNAKVVTNTFERLKSRRSAILQTFITAISNSIDNIYKNVTGSTSAQALLIPQNPEEPYLSGIIYSCIAPGKKVHVMEGLSGGERTLSSIALLLAIQKAKPAPFFILDEVDAALDPGNINKLVKCIRNEKKFMQFIVISLKLRLRCQADALMGITTAVEDLQSCVYTLDLQKYRS